MPGSVGVPERPSQSDGPGIPCPATRRACNTRVEKIHTPPAPIGREAFTLANYTGHRTSRLQRFTCKMHSFMLFFSLRPCKRNLSGSQSRSSWLEDQAIPATTSQFPPSGAIPSIGFRETKSLLDRVSQKPDLVLQMASEKPATSYDELPLSLIHI